MKAQMIRVISSPSSSTIGFLTAIFCMARRGYRWAGTIRSMATVERRSAATHKVFNQPPPLEDYNPFDADRALSGALRREGAGGPEGRARELGAICGSHQTIRWGFEANERKPVLRTHDRY